MFSNINPAIRILVCLSSCFFNLNKLFLPPQVDVLTVGPTSSLISTHREVEEALCQIYKGEIATADVLK